MFIKKSSLTHYFSTRMTLTATNVVIPTYYVVFLTVCLWNSAEGGSVALTSENFDRHVGNHELVFLNFYADWCKFSQILAPVFDETADKLKQEFPEEGKLLLGKVDCDKETSVAVRFHITKYPTLKVIHHGKIKREYRGQRSSEALISHIRDLLRDPIVEIKQLEDEEKVDNNKRAMVAYFKTQLDPEYNVFRKVAADLRDDCQFFLNTRTDIQTNLTENKIIFKQSRTKLGEKDEIYPGVLLSYDELSAWATNRCIPLVREITFENAEELTEEGLPFLILFHHPDDKESVEIYSREVQSQLSNDKHSINVLTADGVKFSHPLHHLGKSQKDLPLIAIDSFRHMYLLPQFNDVKIPGRLKEFVSDLYSGKLHREFHYGPDPVTQSEAEPDQPISTNPPESTFRKLAPSKNRYTLLRDEL
ncbi:endoplasmic reticulum resident protein 44 [Centruroides vittatus]|uniref:endoplasmic reticulum resident protein 44 n=1 Tax=Centruroides vittatus TaxID=120091 RepID=UPI00350EA5B7